MQEYVSSDIQSHYPRPKCYEQCDRLICVYVGGGSSLPKQFVTRPIFICCACERYIHWYTMSGCLSSSTSTFMRNLLLPSSGFTIKSYKFQWSRVSYTSNHTLYTQTQRFKYFLSSERNQFHPLKSSTAAIVSYMLHCLLYLTSSRFEND